MYVFEDSIQNEFIYFSGINLTGSTLIRPIANLPLDNPAHATSSVDSSQNKTLKSLNIPNDLLNIPNDSLNIP